MNWPFAYFITFTTYGSRLHGDERGSVERGRFGEASSLLDSRPLREDNERLRMAMSQVVLNNKERQIVDAAIRKTCDRNQWRLLAINVRTNHVHLLVSAAAQPELVMRSCKAWATRGLREGGFGRDSKIWTRHGSTKYVWREDEAETVWRYVVHGQQRHIEDVARDARPDRK